MSHILDLMRLPLCLFLVMAHPEPRSSEKPITECSTFRKAAMLSGKTNPSNFYLSNNISLSRSCCLHRYHIGKIKCFGPRPPIRCRPNITTIAKEFLDTPCVNINHQKLPHSKTPKHVGIVRSFPLMLWPSPCTCSRKEVNHSIIQDLLLKL
jgi:hypothetical protein